MRWFGRGPQLSTDGSNVRELLERIDSPPARPPVGPADVTPSTVTRWERLDGTRLRRWTPVRQEPIWIDVPELAALAQDEISDAERRSVYLDVRAITALQATSELWMLREASTLDDLALRIWPSDVPGPADARLDDLLALGVDERSPPSRLDEAELRLSRYSWDPNKLAWINSGGSHRFSAARYLAGRDRRAVRVRGALEEHILDSSAVRGLNDRYWMLRLPPHLDSHLLVNALCADGVVSIVWFMPSGLELPDRGPHSLGPYRDRRGFEREPALLIERSSRGAGDAVHALVGGGAFDVGRHLVDLLAPPPSPNSCRGNDARGRAG